MVIISPRNCSKYKPARLCDIGDGSRIGGGGISGLSWNIAHEIDGEKMYSDDVTEMLGGLLVKSQVDFYINAVRT